MTKYLTEESERGKRRVSRWVELTLLLLIIGSVMGYDNAYKVLELILVYAVGLIVALRGLDSHYAPKRV